MALPTDRGIAVIRNESDGRKSVLVCASFHDYKPVDVFALHFSMPAVVVHDGVRLVALEPNAEKNDNMFGGFTDGVVTVFRDDSTVHLLPPGTGTEAVPLNR